MSYLICHCSTANFHWEEKIPYGGQTHSREHFNKFNHLKFFLYCLWREEKKTSSVQLNVFIAVPQVAIRDVCNIMERTMCYVLFVLIEQDF